MKLKMSITIFIVAIIIVSESIAAPRKGKRKGRTSRNMGRRSGFIKQICKRNNFQGTSLCRAFNACKEVADGDEEHLACYNDQCTNNYGAYSDFFCEGIKCKLNSKNKMEISQNNTTARECIIELCKFNCMNEILDVLESKFCRIMMVNKCRKDFKGRNSKEERRSCTKDAKCVTADQTDDEIGGKGDTGSN